MKGSGRSKGQDRKKIKGKARGDGTDKARCSTAKDT